MENDRLINITVGAGRKATVWNRQELMWSEMCEKLGIPMRTAETYAEYIAMPKAQQDALKDVGGFVGGTLKGMRRLRTAVEGRDIITLDLDNIPAGMTGDILRRIADLRIAYCVYSTRKHCEAAPRLRVLIPLNRTITADEYEPTARKLAEFVGMEYCDPTTFEAHRLMYWPNCSADSAYVYTYSDEPFVDADGILNLYADWRNVSEWKGVSAPKLPRGAKQSDPTEKSGIVGAFCRTYNVYDVINDLLAGVYIPAGEERYTFAGGSTTGGAVVYDDGKFLYSFHATDPASGKLCNAFDLARLHLFGSLDDEAAPDTPANRLPSFTEMCRYAVKDTAVSSAMNAEKYDKAVAAFNSASFSDFVPEGTPPDNTEWIKLLSLSSDTGKPKKTIDNIVIILENDPLLKGKIRFDEFSNRVQLTGSVPWDSKTELRRWTDNDDSGIRFYLEKVYGLTGVNKILDACSLVCHRHTVNVVREYLGGLPAWDGIPRLDRIFCDYLGAADTPYVRAVARKSFTAAVARAMMPGIKYDNVPILAGPQGIGKSTLLQKMGGIFFSDSLSTFEGKDALELIQGSWIIELGELNGLSKAEMNVVKQFLSKQCDIFREPYGRRTAEYPRRCVFFGTTNEDEFLRDRTGNRRFWPIDCFVNAPTRNVFTQLAGEVPQLWAEALAFWKDGETLYLDKEMEKLATEVQETHSVHDAKEGLIKEFISRKLPPDWDKRNVQQRKVFWAAEFGKCDDTGFVERTKVCALEIWCEALNGEVKQMRKSDAAEINAILGQISSWKRAANGVQFGGGYGYQRGFIKQ